MALNKRHVKIHNGKREYTGEEASNLVMGQGGVDILIAQNDIITAGAGATIGGATNIAGMADVKGWVSITTKRL